MGHLAVTLMNSVNYQILRGKTWQEQGGYLMCLKACNRNTKKGNDFFLCSRELRASPCRKFTLPANKCKLSRLDAPLLALMSGSTLLPAQPVTFWCQALKYNAKWIKAGPMFSVLLSRKDQKPLTHTQQFPFPFSHLLGGPSSPNKKPLKILRSTAVAIPYKCLTINL